MIFSVVSVIKSRLEADKRKIRLKLQKDKHFAELIKGSGVAFVLKILGIICGYIFTLLVTRTLGAESWGIFSLCLVVLQIASVIGRLGMDTALLRFTAEYAAKGEIGILKEIYKKALILVVPFSIFVAVSVYFLSPILSAKAFHKPYLTPYFKIISLAIVPFVLLWIHSEGIRGLKKIKESQLLQQTAVFGAAIIFFGAGLFCVRSDFLPLISYSMSILVFSVVSILLWCKYLASFLSPSVLSSSFSTFNTASAFYIPSCKSLLSVSVPMLLSNSLMLVMSWADIVMLGIFRSAQEVGIYNVVLRISILASISLVAINTIAAPKFAELWGKRNVKALVRVAQQSTRLMFWISFPVLFLFLFFPKFILGMFGEDFKIGAMALMILTVGQFVNVVAGSVGYVLMMTGYQQFHQKIILIGTLCNVFLNYILIPRYGIVGAAIASAMSVTFWNLIFTIKVKLLYKKFIFYVPLCSR